MDNTFVHTLLYLGNSSLFFAPNQAPLCRGCRRRCDVSRIHAERLVVFGRFVAAPILDQKALHGRGSDRRPEVDDELIVGVGANTNVVGRARRKEFSVNFPL